MNKADLSGRLARWVLGLQPFDYKIIHRAGKKHMNADALSRPICTIQIAQAKENTNKDNSNEANLSAAELDPYEDSFLVHFLKFGTFINGSSNNQKKRVFKLAKNYKYDNDIIYFIKDDEFKEIPKIDQRKELFEKCYNLGHFSQEEAYRRLKSKFYWKTMKQDIEDCVKKCIPCCTYAKLQRTNEHPALSTKIHIDLIKSEWI